MLCKGARVSSRFSGCSARERDFSEEVNERLLTDYRGDTPLKNAILNEEIDEILRMLRTRTPFLNI